jgi:hypothetical protein
LTVRGENVVQIDIKSSQPTVLCELVRPHVPPDELARYQNLVESGKFYEQLAEDINSTRASVKEPVLIYLCGPWFEEKPSALLKGNLSESDRVGFETLYKVSVWFRSEFPSISSYLRAQKLNPIHKKRFDTPVRRRAGKCCGTYGIISHLLQKLESEIVVETCCKALFEEFPEIILATVHDEIIVPERHTTIACKYVMDGFSKFNLKPKLHVKRFGKSLNA